MASHVKQIKKTTRKEIERKLNESLFSMKPLLGKSFDKKVKKAAKVLTGGIKKIKMNASANGAVNGKKKIKDAKKAAVTLSQPAESHL